MKRDEFLVKIVIESDQRERGNLVNQVREPDEYNNRASITIEIK